MNQPFIWDTQEVAAIATKALETMKKQRAPGFVVDALTDRKDEEDVRTFVNLVAVHRKAMFQHMTQMMNENLAGTVMPAADLVDDITRLHAAFFSFSNYNNSKTFVPKSVSGVTAARLFHDAAEVVTRSLKQMVVRNNITALDNPENDIVVTATAAAVIMAKLAKQEALAGLKTILTVNLGAQVAGTLTREQLAVFRAAYGKAYKAAEQNL